MAFMFWVSLPFGPPSPTSPELCPGRIHVKDAEHRLRRRRGAPSLTRSLPAQDAHSCARGRGEGLGRQSASPRATLSFTVGNRRNAWQLDGTRRRSAPHARPSAQRTQGPGYRLRRAWAVSAAQTPRGLARVPAHTPAQPPILRKSVKPPPARWNPGKSDALDNKKRDLLPWRVSIPCLRRRSLYVCQTTTDTCIVPDLRRAL